MWRRDMPEALLAAIETSDIPGVRAVRMALGPDGGEVDLPPPALDLHVHASTPCTELSLARHTATDTEVKHSLEMLRWVVELFLTRGDVSWSIENVSTPTTRRVLQDYKDRFPESVDFGESVLIIL